MTEECDLAIIGGGPVGSALALALADSDLSILLLEARPPAAAQADPRALALAQGSRLLLEKLGVWQDLAEVTPIHTIHITQQHGRGRTCLTARELNVPALGYVLPYPALQGALERALQQRRVHMLHEATVIRLEQAPDAARLHYQHGGNTHAVSARLAVVADGGRLLEHSHPPRVTEYGQSAVICHVTCAHPQAHTAFEFFTPQGPLALLPYRDGYEIVWSGSHQQVAEMLDWDDTSFRTRLQRHFGDTLGEFLSVGPRSSFPLRRKMAPAITLPHTVLIGNAAQTLHPVAGQGFNLGLRDAWELARLILRAAPAALGSAAMLDRYRRLRRLDRNGGARFTDGLVRLFSNDKPYLHVGRDLGLTLLDHVPAAKRFVAHRMMYGAQG